MATALSPVHHVVIFPHMAQGHTIPLLDISKALSNRGLKVTIITTPSNAPFISSRTNKHPNITLSIIPFPKVPDLPQGCENTADLPSIALFTTFIEPTKKMKQSFEDVLRNMIDGGCPSICVISDFFLGWTLESGHLFDIPRIVSDGMGVFAMVICKSPSLHVPDVKDLSLLDPIDFSVLKFPFTLNKGDIPEMLLNADPNDPSVCLTMELAEADANSWAVIVNSFEEIEGEYVGALESNYFNEAKTYCVGPLLYYDQLDQELDASYIKWLDKYVESNESGSVIYVSFGTQTHLSNDQMDEIAFGLEMAGHPFIWVVRSKTWAPPDGWTKRVKEEGLVVYDWVEQRSILAHPSIGGFLSHCGWNSVLESLANGVPLLTWPMLDISEQALNAKLVTMGLGFGLVVPQRDVGGEKITTIERGVICERVKELMEGVKGRKVKERAQELGQLAWHSVEKGGSRKQLDELIERLTNKNM
ncbi:UDP-glycosyltransferase 90A1-like [Castanea sativa]|uniref:UDP-glycosyltransferase 90A1-like n=1 Tax=Castanea sativa TaxID=21020 RepID=UPI003F64DBD5